MAELSELSDSVTSLSDRYTLKQYIVQDGDTIHRVAQKMLGSAEKAIDVIEFNKLSYPFIQGLQDTRLPNTVTMGDTLWIPEFTSEQSDNTDLSYLGGDLMLVDRDLSGGDLQEDTYGDLQIVENLDSLIQDLKSRLQIEIGTMLFHPLYGNKLQRIVGQKGNPEWEQLARLEATSMFLSDDRIQNVESLIVTRIQGGISVDAVLEVAGSATPVPFSSYLKEDDYHGFAD
jgi:phage baseplate assembly protein W